MNTPNNKRRKESQERIEKIFVELIQKKEINKISVTDICKKAKVNRSTFYANYIDIYDLADKIKEKLSRDIINLYGDRLHSESDNISFERLLTHIKDNRLFYKTYFKLASDEDIVNFGYDKNSAKKYYGKDEFLDYHIAFFAAGFNAIINKWLSNDCKEPVEIIQKIMVDEYNK